MFRRAGDEHKRAVVESLHVHQGAEVVQLLREGRLGLVPHDFRVRPEVLDVGPPHAVSVAPTPDRNMGVSRTTGAQPRATEDNTQHILTVPGTKYTSWAPSLPRL